MGSNHLRTLHKVTDNGDGGDHPRLPFHFKTPQQNGEQQNVRCFHKGCVASTHPSPLHSPLFSLTYRSRHGQHPQHAVAVEVDHPPPRCLHSLHLVGAIGLWGGALVAGRGTVGQQIKLEVKHSAAMGQAATVATKQIYIQHCFVLCSLDLWIEDVETYTGVNIRQHTDAMPGSRFQNTPSLKPAGPLPTPTPPCGRAKAAGPPRHDREPLSSPRSWPPRSGWAPPKRR